MELLHHMVLVLVFLLLGNIAVGVKNNYKNTNEIHYLNVFFFVCLFFPYGSPTCFCRGTG